jgi:anti-anti-sigma factor
MKTFEYEIRDGYMLVYLYGDINIHRVGEVELNFDLAMKQSPPVMAVDCRYLDYVDSSAIAMLVKMYKRAAEREISLVFLEVSPAIQETFQMINLHRYIRILTREDFELEFNISFPG